MRPLVAVLTPVFNGEAFLQETMDCVQQSDYENLVHVVIDNASTDRTPEIIAGFRNARVPVVVHRNEQTIPILDNINLAAMSAPIEAKYVRVICADDLMSPQAISKMVDIAERSEQIGIVGCQCLNDGIFGIDLPQETDVFEGQDIVRAFLRHETRVLSGMHFLFRRDLFSAQTPPYDVRFGATMDSGCAIRAALAGRFGFVPEVLAEFRHHEDSYSATANTRGDFLFEWILLIDAYGPEVFTEEEFRLVRSRDRNFYLLKSLDALLRQRNRSYFRTQMRRLASIGDPVFPLDFVSAIAARLVRTISPRGRAEAPRSTPSLAELYQR